MRSVIVALDRHNVFDVVSFACLSIAHPQSPPPTPRYRRNGRQAGRRPATTTERDRNDDAAQGGGQTDDTNKEEKREDVAQGRADRQFARRHISL